MFSNNANAGGGGGMNINNALNNAVNVFPTTYGKEQTQAKLQKLLYATTNRGPTEIQCTLAYSIYDDSIEYMNTLEMNRAASYTFGHRIANDPNVSAGHNNTLNKMFPQSIANEMWELLIDLTLNRFAQHSVLALTKTISLIQHVLVHGSESCVMNGELLYKIEMALQPLRNLNTALVEHQMVDGILNGGASGGNDIDVFAQFGTKASAAMMKLRGGSVDKGHPVRVRANNLYGIVSIPDNLRKMRNAQQPSGSLVPIGSAKQVGYITDEGRYRLLQEKMAADEKAQRQKQLQEEQRLRATRSNLAGKSATDSFGGGYASNSGNGVVGAANSLEDMIKSAKYELEQHKAKRAQTVSSLKTGYTDDPYTRQQKVNHLQRNGVENDPEFIKKEKALQDALEYLEEMQKMEQEKVGNLLEGDLLGSTDAAPTSGVGTVTGGFDSGSADLLGFDSSPAPAPTADLLGFGGPSASEPVVPAQTPVVSPGPPAPTRWAAPTLATGGGNALARAMANPENDTNSATAKGGTNAYSDNMRPSLVTGISPPLLELDEEAEAEKSRKMEMAAGLFAGVVPSNGDSTTPIPQKKPIMQSGNSSNVSALDELIPTSDSALPAPAAPTSVSAFDANDLTSPSDQDSDPFGMGLMGGSSPIPPAPKPVTSLDPFGMGPMGGSSDSADVPPAPMPSMAPPPPPTEPPPPPPPGAEAAGPSMPMPDATNMLGANPSVEQMQAMIQQQQQQMQQMMQMMQQMQMQGSNNPNSGMGGWPPSS